ncbi:MAG: hypothetical protein JSS32_04690 [Verrucomicrobia bacterium]|nr:hypothetical protein [Verrucomicrobiota bacterium]
MFRVDSRASSPLDPVGAARAKYNEINRVLKQQGKSLIDVYEVAIGIFDHASQREFRMINSTLLKEVQIWKEKACEKISKCFGKIINTTKCKENSEVFFAREKFIEIKSIIDEATTWEEFEKATDLMDKANSSEFRPTKKDREASCLIYGYKREANRVIDDLQAVLMKQGASKKNLEDDENDLQFVEEHDDISASSISRQSSALSAASRQSPLDFDD